MKVRISYPLDRRTPLYPGSPPVSFEPFRSTVRGDSSNSTIITFSSHAGTHIDLPRHFCGGGETVVDLLDEENVVEPVYCVDLPRPRGDSIHAGDLRSLAIPGDARGLLVRTGFFQYRSKDPEIYTREHPWVDPGVATFLREKYPDLIVFGLDTISISNSLQRTAGHEAHRLFLCGKRPILLLEDLDLSFENLSLHPWKLTIYPLILDELDGVPVLAFLE